jgi:hypothetical protein
LVKRVTSERGIASDRNADKGCILPLYLKIKAEERRILTLTRLLYVVHKDLTSTHCIPGSWVGARETMKGGGGSATSTLLGLECTFVQE